MIRRLLNFALIVLILFGGYRAWQSSRERARLVQTRDHLNQLLGPFPVTDPSRVHVLALKTDDPLHFAWRFHVPANLTATVKVASGREYTSGGIGSYNEPSEFIGRVRLKKMPTPKGGYECYTSMRGISGVSTFENPAFRLLKPDDWRRIKVEQIGAPEIAVLPPDKPSVLLRLSLPDELATEARKKLPPEEARSFNPVLLEITFIPPKPSGL